MGAGGVVWQWHGYFVSLSIGSSFGLFLVCAQALPTRRCWGSLGHFPVAHTTALVICRFWNRLVAMPDTRLTKQAFLENCALATQPGHSNKQLSTCWGGGRLHECPGKASWPLQGPQRERHAHTNKTILKTKNNKT